ncbi:ATP-binding protein [Rheinheimera sp.]|uniref:ATP-binding protein n=1 Tax=Rheinheimera sp. TaxID=1869214 RepID=UPI0027B883A6|nr:ATP-binding protein [Rheinheimera sp.]
MRRLFLHFYLFMLLVLLGIGWSVDRLWQQSLPQQQPGWVSLLGQSLAYQLNQPDTNAEQIADQLNLTLQNMPIDAIAWSEPEQQALVRGQLVPLFSGNMVYFYQHSQDEKQLLQFGPVEIDASSHQGYFFTLLFFALLAIAVALWLWPLARDIQQLQRQLQKFGQGMQLPEQKLPAHSLLAPIANSAQQMAEQIRRLVALQREMTHAVSHELRTPLARLSFALEMQNIAENDKQAMLQDVKELDQLVDEMLDYARLESQSVQLKPEQVNLAELLDNLVEKLTPLPGATISLQHPPQLWLLCDGHYLERALQNLLVNAKRYAKQQVLLSLRQEQDQLVFCVEDDGPGIAPAQRDKILQPFVRLDESRCKGHGGFGLGLAIVSRIVSWHQGQILIGDSALGGALFQLRLPIKQPQHSTS